MNEIMSTIQGNLLEIIITLIGIGAAWLGTKCKQMYQKYADTQTKQEVVKISVQWVEQMVKIGQIALDDRLTEAKNKVLSLLSEAGITISDEELETMIESAVYSFTSSLNDEKKEEK